MTVRLKDLEDAACDVVQIIKQFQEFAQTRLAVCGGLALWHYLPDYRQTDNIDFITDLSSLDLLRTRLLEHPNSPFMQNQQALFYCSPAGRAIQIKISTENLPDYLLDSTRVVHEIPYGEVPYIPLKGLIIIKLQSSWFQPTSPARRRRDTADAEALVSRKIPCCFVHWQGAAEDDKPGRPRSASAGAGPEETVPDPLREAALMVSTTARAPAGETEVRQQRRSYLPRRVTSSNITTRMAV
ncbi:hypothetical protein SAMD00023353_0403200 [Rosellinia necatrix]|uniref:Uncharacterized protein n=1 Tax=Rosellinia necatrix TaxID=77044 RepID=A0A1S7UJ63_ROSNE|nr:hypothetical protein SAMD00023353_0403200 [Rosellinia necatrix]